MGNMIGHAPISNIHHPLNPILLRIRTHDQKKPKSAAITITKAMPCWTISNLLIATPCFFST